VTGLAYAAGAILRRPSDHGELHFQRQTCRLGKAFHHQVVALLPARSDGAWAVYYARFLIARLDEREASLAWVRGLDQEPTLA
jgi:hypothetical protein